MQSVVQAKTNDNYSLEIMVRYAFDYEVQNKIRLKPNQNDPELQAVYAYMKRRIEEISQKYK